MKKIIVALAFILTTASLASAQAIKVRVSAGDGTIPDAVRTSLLPMISANTHFTVVDDNSWDMYLESTCGKISQTTVCTYMFTYSPDRYIGVSLSKVALIADSDLTEIAKGVFSDLIDLTTPDNLKKGNDALDVIFGGVVKAVRDHDAKPKQSGSAS